MRIKLEQLQTEIDVPYLWLAPDGSAHYRRPFPKKDATGRKLTPGDKVVALGVSDGESIALLCSLLAEIDDLSFTSTEETTKLVNRWVGMLPRDVAALFKRTHPSNLTRSLILYLDETTFTVAHLRLAASAYLNREQDGPHHFRKSVALLRQLTVPQVEAMMQLSRFGELQEALEAEANQPTSAK